MALLTVGIPPQPVGQGGRKINVPVQATTQIYEGAMVAEISGAAVPGSTAGAGGCIGVAEQDALGGASNGAVRMSIWTDKVFIFANGANAVADTTPLFTTLYMEDDHTVGTGGIGGTGEGVAGLFFGMEDDGRVRVYIGPSAAATAVLGLIVPVNGTNLTNTASQTVNVVPGATQTRYLMGTMGQNSTVTLGTTGAVVGDIVRIVSTNAAAFTLAVVNGGPGAGTLATIVASKPGYVQAYFNGTNWLYDGSSNN